LLERKPKGYVGLNHETLGSDILSVVAALPLPNHLLGAEVAERLGSVDSGGWYPIEWLLEAMEVLDKRIGNNGLLQMGRKLFQLSHAAQFKVSAKSAADLVFGIDGMYKHANRGTAIGGWEVLAFEPGTAELEKTTPHHCVMEEGIFSAALLTLEVPALVRQTACFRTGADACRFLLTSPVHDEKWMGGRARIDTSGGRR
jgi:hypothetical protein